MRNNYFIRVAEKTPTTFWVNNVTCEQAKKAIAAGAVNCTQNPGFAWKIIDGSNDSEKAKVILDELIRNNKDDEAVLMDLQLALIADICKVFEPLNKQTNGIDGWVTIQGSPLHEDLDTIMNYAHKCHKTVPNIMIKIPATEDGIKALRLLAKENYALLATEVMSVSQAMDVCEIFEEAYYSNPNPSAMAFAHIPGIFDEQLQKTVDKEKIDVDTDALWQAGITVAKKIRRMMDDRGYHARMLSGGARGLHHFTEMVGARSGVTINWDGTADKLIELDGIVIDRFNNATAPDVIDELREKVEEFRQAYDRDGLSMSEYEGFGPVGLFRKNFEDAWNKCLVQIAAQRKEL